MAGTFEVGSIVARLKADDTEFIKGMKSAVEVAKKIGKQLQSSLKLKADSSRFVTGIRTAARAAKDVGRRIKDSLGFKLDPARVVAGIKVLLRKFSDFAKRVKTLLAPIGKIIKSAILLPLKLVRSAARITGRAMRRAFRGMRSIFSRLRGMLFSLNGILATFGAAFGALQFVRRADEVSSLSAAFANLTRSVGSTADELLGKLRVATRGTVSDLSLMRTANNAVLLGVVKSANSYADLAKVARRLGRAVGRDAVSAINDLTIGIGRQSRLILDNLGLIVRIGEANDVYAARLGKAVAQLTDAEKRQAFFNAALDAGRKKVKELGEDTLGLTDYWGKFTAQIQNVFSRLAVAFVGEGSIFGAIGNFLEDNRRKIAIYAKFIARVFAAIKDGIVTAVKAIFTGLKAGTIITKLSSILSEIFNYLTAVISTFVGALFGDLGWQLIKLIGGLLGQVGNEITRGITGIVWEIGATVTKAALWIVSKVPVVSDLLGLGSERDLSEAYARMERGLKRAKGAYNQHYDDNRKILQEFVRETTTSVLGAVKQTSDEVWGSLKGVAQQGVEQGGILSEGFLTAFEGIEKAFKQLDLDIADPFVDFTAIRVNKELQGMADVLNSIMDIRSRLKETMPDIINERDLAQGVPKLQEFKRQLEALNGAMTELRSAPEPLRKALVERFLTIFDQMRPTMASARQDMVDLVTSVESRLRELGEIPGVETFTGKIESIGVKSKIAEKKIEELRDVAKTFVFRTGDLDTFRASVEKIGTESEKSGVELASFVTDVIDVAENARKTSDAIGAFVRNLGLIEERTGETVDDFRDLGEFFETLGEEARTGIGGLALFIEQLGGVEAAGKGIEGAMGAIGPALLRAANAARPALIDLRASVTAIGEEAEATEVDIERMRVAAERYALGLSSFRNFEEAIREVGITVKDTGAGLDAFTDQVVGVTRETQQTIKGMDEFVDAFTKAGNLITTGGGFTLLQDHLEETQSEFERSEKAVLAVGEAIDTVVRESAEKIDKFNQGIESIAVASEVGIEGIKQLKESAQKLLLGTIPIETFKAEVENVGITSKVSGDELGLFTARLTALARELVPTGSFVEGFSEKILAVARSLNLTKEQLAGLEDGLSRFSRGAGRGAINLSVLRDRARELADQAKVDVKATNELLKAIDKLAVFGSDRIKELGRRIESLKPSFGLGEDAVNRLKEALELRAVGAIGIEDFNARVRTIGETSEIVGDQMELFTFKVEQIAAEADITSQSLGAFVKQILATATAIGFNTQQLNQLQRDLLELGIGAGRGALNLNILRDRIEDLTRSAAKAAKGIDIIPQAVSRAVSKSIRRLRTLATQLEGIAPKAEVGVVGFRNLQEAAEKYAIGDLGLTEFRDIIEEVGRDAGKVDAVLEDFANRIQTVADRARVANDVIGQMTKNVLEAANKFNLTTQEAETLQHFFETLGQGAVSGATGVSAVAERMKLLGGVAEASRKQAEALTVSLRGIVTKGLPGLVAMERQVYALGVEFGFVPTDIRKIVRAIGELVAERTHLGQFSDAIRQIAKDAEVPTNRIEDMVTEVRQIATAFKGTRREIKGFVSDLIKATVDIGTQAGFRVFEEDVEMLIGQADRFAESIFQMQNRIELSFDQATGAVQRYENAWWQAARAAGYTDDQWKELFSTLREEYTGIVSVKDWEKAVRRVGLVAGRTGEEIAALLETMREQRKVMLEGVDAAKAAVTRLEFLGQRAGFTDKQMEILRGSIGSLFDVMQKGAVRTKLLISSLYDLGTATEKTALRWEEIRDTIQDVTEEGRRHIIKLSSELSRIGKEARLSNIAILELKYATQQYVFDSISAEEYADRLTEIAETVMRSGKDMDSFRLKVQELVDQFDLGDEVVDAFSQRILNAMIKVGVSAENVEKARQVLDRYFKEFMLGSVATTALTRTSKDLLALATTGEQALKQIFLAISDATFRAAERFNWFRQYIPLLVKEFELSEDAIRDMTDAAREFTLDRLNYSEFIEQLERIAVKAGVAGEKLDKFNSQMESLAQVSDEHRTSVDDFGEAIIRAVEAAGGSVEIQRLKAAFMDLAAGTRVSRTGIRAIEATIDDTVAQGVARIADLDRELRGIADEAKLSEAGLKAVQRTILQFSAGLLPVNKLRSELNLVAQTAEETTIRGRSLTDILKEIAIGAQSAVDDIEKMNVSILRAAQRFGLSGDKLTKLENLLRGFGAATLGARFDLGELGAYLGILGDGAIDAAKEFEGIPKALRDMLLSSDQVISKIWKRIASIKGATEIAGEGLEKLRNIAARYALGIVGLDVFRKEVERIGIGADFTGKKLTDFVDDVAEASDVVALAGESLRAFEKSVLAAGKTFGLTGAEWKQFEQSVITFGISLKEGTADFEAFQLELEEILTSARVGAEGAEVLKVGFSDLFAGASTQMEELGEKLEGIVKPAKDSEKAVLAIQDAFKKFGVGAEGRKAIEDALNAWGKGANRGEKEVKGLLATVDKLIFKSKTARDESFKIRKGIEGIAAALDLKDRAPVLVSLFEKFGIGTESVDKLNAKLRQFTREQIAATSGAKKFFTELSKAYKTTGVLSPRFEALLKVVNAWKEAMLKTPEAMTPVEAALKKTGLAVGEFDQKLAPYKTGGPKLKALELEVRLIGLTESEKELKKFDITWEKVLEKLLPAQRDLVDKARAELEKFLKQKKNAKELEEASKAIAALGRNLQSLQRQIAQVEIGRLGAQFQKLEVDLENALQKSGKAGNKIRDMFAKMQAAAARFKIAETNKKLRDLQKEVEGVGKTELQKKVNDLSREFKEFGDSLQRATLLSKDAKRALQQDMGKAMTDLQRKTVELDFHKKFDELTKSIQESKEEIEALNRYPINELARQMWKGQQAVKRLGEELSEVANKLNVDNILGGARKIGREFDLGTVEVSQLAKAMENLVFDRISATEFAVQVQKIGRAALKSKDEVDLLVEKALGLSDARPVIAEIGDELQRLTDQFIRTEDGAKALRQALLDRMFDLITPEQYRERLEAIGKEAKLSGLALKDFIRESQNLGEGLGGTQAIQAALADIREDFALSAEASEQLKRALRGYAFDTTSAQDFVVELRRIGEAANKSEEEIAKLIREVSGIAGTVADVTKLRKELLALAKDFGLPTKTVKELQRVTSERLFDLLTPAEYEEALRKIGEEAGKVDEELERFIRTTKRLGEGIGGAQRIRDSLADIRKDFGLTDETFKLLRKALQEYSFDTISADEFILKLAEVGKEANFSDTKVKRLTERAKRLADGKRGAEEVIDGLIDLREEFGLTITEADKLRQAMQDYSLGVINADEFTAKLKEVAKAAVAGDQKVTQFVDRAKRIGDAVQGPQAVKAGLEDLEKQFGIAGVAADEFRKAAQGYTFKLIDADELSTQLKRIKDIAGLTDDEVKQLFESIRQIAVGVEGPQAIEVGLQSLQKEFKLVGKAADDFRKAVKDYSFDIINADEFITQLKQLRKIANLNDIQVRQLTEGAKALAEGAEGPKKIKTGLQELIDEFKLSGKAAADFREAIRDYSFEEVGAEDFIKRLQQIASDAKKGDEEIKQLTERARRLVDGVEGTRAVVEGIQELIDEFKIAGEAADDFRRAIRDYSFGEIGADAFIQRLEEIATRAEVGKDRVEEFIAKVKEIAEGAEGTKRLRAGLQELIKEFRLAGKVADDFRKAIRDYTFGEIDASEFIKRLEQVGEAANKGEKEIAELTRKAQELTAGAEGAKTIVDSLEALVKQAGLSGAVAAKVKEAFSARLFDLTGPEEYRKRLRRIGIEAGLVDKELRDFVSQTYNLGEGFIGTKVIEESLEKLREGFKLSTKGFNELKAAIISYRFDELNTSEFIERIRQIAKESDVAKDRIGELIREVAGMAGVVSSVEMLQSAIAKLKEEFDLSITAVASLREALRERVFEITTAEEYEEKLRAVGVQAGLTGDALERFIQKSSRLAEGLPSVKALRKGLKDLQKDFRLNDDQLKKLQTTLQQRMFNLIDAEEYAERLREIAKAAEMGAEKMREFLAAGMSLAEAEGALAQYKQDYQAMVQSLIGAQEKKDKKAEEEAAKKKALDELKDWSQFVSSTVGQGLWEAFEKGESFSKSWAKISADFFRREFEKVLENLGDGLTKIFEGIGLGAGVGGAITGLIGLAGALYNAMESQSTSTVEDFSEAINSSEAVRGVVAGPTNVAISKVGDSLKQALRTSEVLLERIAIAVESGGGGGGGGAGPGGGELSGNAALPLTTSSPT